MASIPENLDEVDRQTRRWLTRLAVTILVIIALIGAAIALTPEAGAAKRPGPPPPAQACIQISAVDPLMEGTYRATVGQQRRIVRVRVKDAPALKAGCWRPVQFRQWFEVGA